MQFLYFLFKIYIFLKFYFILFYIIIFILYKLFNNNILSIIKKVFNLI